MGKHGCWCTHVYFAFDERAFDESLHVREDGNTNPYKSSWFIHVPASDEAFARFLSRLLSERAREAKLDSQDTLCQNLREALEHAQAEYKEDACESCAMRNLVEHMEAASAAETANATHCKTSGMARSIASLLVQSQLDVDTLGNDTSASQWQQYHILTGEVICTATKATCVAAHAIPLHISRDATHMALPSIARIDMTETAQQWLGFSMSRSAANT